MKNRKKTGAVFLAALLMWAGAVRVNETAWADGSNEELGGKIVVGVLPFGTGEDEETTENKKTEKGEVKEAREKMARGAILQSLSKFRAIAALKAEFVDEAAGKLGVDLSKEMGLKDAVAIGQNAGAQYMLLGKVIKLSQRNDVAKDTGFFSSSYKTLVTASAQLSMKVIDVNAGKVLMILPGYGIGRTEFSSKAAGGFLLAGGLLDALQDISASNKQDEQAKLEAVADASSDLANKIKGELTGEYLSVRAAKSGESIEINADSSSGLNEEDLYLVYLDGTEKRDKDGVLIEREKLPLAVVKVDRVHRGYSVANSVPSGGDLGLIQKGDKMEPISREKSRELAGGKKFLKERPKAPSGTRAALFGQDGDSASNSSRETPASPRPGEQSTQKPAGSLTAPAAKRPFENNSTDPAKVVATYGLAGGDANTRRIAHINARKLSGKKAYDKYVELANSFDGDYLAAYQAGRLAQQLKKNDDAKAWYDKALAINPTYKPAQDARKKMK
jgi:tetratricopeptide (TPR) repeat protein